MQELVRDLMDLQRRVALLESLERRRPIGARVYNSANISITNATPTALTFDSEIYDTDSLHSTSVNTDRLTASIAGYYAINANVSFDTNTTGYRQIWLEIDGATIIQLVNMMPVTGDNTRMALSTITRISAASYVRIIVYQTSGGNLNVIRAAGYSPEFAIHLLDPA